MKLLSIAFSALFIIGFGTITSADAAPSKHSVTIEARQIPNDKEKWGKFAGNMHIKALSGHKKNGALAKFFKHHSATEGKEFKERLQKLPVTKHTLKMSVEGEKIKTTGVTHSDNHANNEKVETLFSLPGLSSFKPLVGAAMN
jgi:hypothetical protein